MSLEIRDRIVSRHRSGEGYQNISAALKVTKSTVFSIILKWKKFGTTKTLPRAGRPDKLRPEFQVSGGNLAPFLRWWQYHAVRMFFSSRDWETRQDQSTERSLMKTCSRALRTSAWGKDSPSNRTMTLSTLPRQLQEWSLNVLEWSSQSPDLNPIEHLWRDLKIAVQRRSPSNLTELEDLQRRMGETLQIQVC